MKKCKLIALLLLFANVCLFAQTKAITGTVSKSETERPIAGAAIKIVNSKMATIPGFYSTNDVIKAIVKII